MVAPTMSFKSFFLRAWLTGWACFLLLTLLLGLLNIEVPKSLGTGFMIASIGWASQQFQKKNGRSFTKREKISAALGIAAINTFLPLLVARVIMTGEAVSLSILLLIGSFFWLFLAILFYCLMSIRPKGINKLIE